jgi:CheY-like chemotaxis protein
MQFDITAASVARALFEDTPDGVVVSDAAGTIVAINPAALRRLGYTRDDLLGRPLGTVLIPSDGEVRIRYKSGLEDVIDVVSVPCEVESAKFVLSFVRDRRQEHAPADTVDGAGATVLVVDDDPHVRWAVESVLSRAGYRVLAAHNADDAVNIARDTAIQALVTDLVLPGLSGLAIASAVLAFSPDTKVLYVSGLHQLPADRLQPGTAFLAKPFAPAELLRRLHELLA